MNRFDIIVGNPPYQEMDGGAKASAKPIYNLFTEKSIKLSKMTLLITPSRWFAGGKGLDKFRKMMINRKDVEIINHFDDASKFFGNSVEIKGGVSYFLINKDHIGKTNFNNNLVDLSYFDIIVSKTESFSLIKKLINKPDISNISNPSSFFGINTNDNKLKDIKIDNNYLKCYVSKHKGFIKYINKSYIKNIDKLNYYRVVTPRAATKGGEGFGNLFISYPNECLSGSYLSFYVNTKKEVDSLLSYLKTNFANYLLSLRKVSQTVKADFCKWIPLVPFDRKWTDEDLYKYFNLTQEEIDLIEKTIK